MIPAAFKVKSPIPARVMAFQTINLSAVIHNYYFMKSKTNPKAIMAPALKADAYGLGAQALALILAREHCPAFFLATLDEAIKVREVAKEPDIFVLGGYTPGTSWDFLTKRLTPVLISPSQVQRWLALQRQENQKLPAVVHLDTGMGRTGLTPTEFEKIQPLLKELSIRFLMSHYANSEDLSHPMNKEQLDTFLMHRNRLNPFLPFSFANSHAFLLPTAYHGDWVRPGISLGGLCPLIQGLKPALSMHSRIVQIKWLPKGSCIGYNNTYTTTGPCRVATIGLGYADGLRWLTSNRGKLKYGPYALPIIGRVSMDFVTVDVTHVPEQLLEEGEWATVFDDAESAHRMAQAADTTIYELQVTLGSRTHRHYI